MMWTCPRCHRQFKSKEQDHYCGEPPETVDAYIAAQPEDKRPRLHQVRDTLRAALPGARECIAWRMPTYRKKQNIIHFAGFEHHIGLYPGAEAMVRFADRFVGYKTSKGAVQFPHNRPLPLELIAEIAKWCDETIDHH